MKRVHAVFILSTLLFPLQLMAGDMAASAIEKAIDAGFSDLERQIIEKYYGKRPVTQADDGGPAEEDEDRSGKKSAAADGKHAKNKDKKKDMPPGLAKRDELPPGLAKRDTLPPGLAKRDLPDDLDKELPPPPEGYERRIVKDVDQAVIVLVEKATGKVADIIKDVVIPRD